MASDINRATDFMPDCVIVFCVRCQLTASNRTRHPLIQILFCVRKSNCLAVSTYPSLGAALATNLWINDTLGALGGRESYITGFRGLPYDEVEPEDRIEHGKPAVLHFVVALRTIHFVAPAEE